MKWKVATDPKTNKPVDGALVSECGAFFFCVVRVMGEKHYMAWHHKTTIASGYDKQAVLDEVNRYAAAQQQPQAPQAAPVDADWFTQGE